MYATIWIVKALALVLYAFALLLVKTLVAVVTLAAVCVAWITSRGTRHGTTP